MTVEHTIPQAATSDQLTAIRAIPMVVSAAVEGGATKITMKRKPGMQREVARAEVEQILGVGA